MEEGVELGLQWCQCWRAGIRERALLSPQTMSLWQILKSEESSDSLKAASPNVNALENVGTEVFLWLTFLLLMARGSADGFIKSPNKQSLLLLLSNTLCLFVTLVCGDLTVVPCPIIPKQDPQG